MPWSMKLNRISGADREKVIEIYGQAQEILVDEAPAIFFFDQQSVKAKQKVLRHYDNPLYSHVVFFYDIYRE